MRSHLVRSVTVLAAVTWTLAAAGPASLAEPRGPCALDRTKAHHSEGLATWNGDYPRPLGRVNAVLIFLRFPDSTPRHSTGQLAADHVTDTRRFFGSASYGKFDFHLTAIPGYVAMPAASTSYGIQRDWRAGPRRRFLEEAVAAADDRVDFGDYQAVFFVADPQAPGVHPDATKVVNLGKPITADGVRLSHIGTIFEAHPPDRYVFAHESAHTFDLPDLYQRPDEEDPSAEWNDQVGDWDLMGDQKGLDPDPLAWHKWKFGWLDAWQVSCLARAGAIRVRLSPVEVPAGRKLIVVKIDRNSVYAVEVRGPYGNDRETCRAGVLIYRVNANTPSGEGPIRVMDANPVTAACRGRAVHPPLADAPFGVGEEYHDTTTRTAVKIAERDRDGGYTVEVTQGR